MRFFTCDCDIATAENCGALTGHAFLGIPVPRALPWAEMLFPLRGGIPDRTTSIRGVEGITISRYFRRGSHTNRPRQRGDWRGPLRGGGFHINPTRQGVMLLLLGRRPNGSDFLGLIDYSVHRRGWPPRRFFAPIWSNNLWRY